MRDPTDQLAGVLSADDYAILSGYPGQGFRLIFPGSLPVDRSRPAWLSL